MIIINTTRLNEETIIRYLIEDARFSIVRNMAKISVALFVLKGSRNKTFLNYDDDTRNSLIFDGRKCKRRNS